MIMNYLHADHGKIGATISWLDTHNAAWIFRDGFYGVATAPDTFMVYTLGGNPVYQISMGGGANAAAESSFGTISAPMTIRGDVWKGIQSRKLERQRLNKVLDQ